MVTDEQRGRYGRWLRRERLARGWSVDETRARLARMGYRIGESSYAEWESGRKRPSRDALPQLVTLFGSEPEPEPTPPEPATSDLSALVAALTEQAEANRQLAAAVADLARSMASPGFLTHAAADGMTTTVLGAIENVRGILLSLDPGRAGTPRRGRRQVSPHGTPASSSPARSAPAGEAPPSDG